MQPIDRHSGTHLHIQIADSLRGRIAAGEFKGRALPTEAALCAAYGVSRYPMRQAMEALVAEGLLMRTRGKGTFVREGGRAARAARSLLAIVLPSLGAGLTGDILAGFERTANDGGFTTVVCVSQNPAHELACIDRCVQSGAAGVAVFPQDSSMIDGAAFGRLAELGIHVSVIDRNPGLEHIDYIGSDNAGGGYMAACHIRQQGFASAAFVAATRNVSSVVERYNGFLLGAAQAELRLLADPDAEGEGGGMLGVERFASLLGAFRAELPFAVFAANDFSAELALQALVEAGLAPGADVGVIGFDNTARCEHLSPPLTSIAQNGYLIGSTAASLALGKIASGSRQSVRHILPTQLIARRSCGEDRPR